MESRAKIYQLVELFSCDFREGRPDSAPALRRNVDGAIQSADDQVPHDPSILPHLYLPEDIDRLFPTALPEPPRRGEDDELSGDELDDPVPKIDAQRRRAKDTWDGEICVVETETATHRSSKRYTLEYVVDMNDLKSNSSVVLNRERTLIDGCMKAGTHLGKTEPTFWLDKVCIDQNNLGDSIHVADTTFWLDKV